MLIQHFLTWLASGWKPGALLLFGPFILNPSLVLCLYEYFLTLSQRWNHYSPVFFAVQTNPLTIDGFDCPYEDREISLYGVKTSVVLLIGCLLPSLNLNNSFSVFHSSLYIFFQTEIHLIDAGLP